MFNLASTQICLLLTEPNWHVFISFSAVQIHDISYIRLYIHVYSSVVNQNDVCNIPFIRLKFIK